MTSPGSTKTRVTRSSPCCEPTVTTTSLGEASVMPSSAMTSQIRSRSRGSPWPELYCRVWAPMPETSSPIMEPTASSGSAVTGGMPPARETTSGRLTTENSARISEVFIPCVRAAYRSASGSRRGWRGTGCGGAPGPDGEGATCRSVGSASGASRGTRRADGPVPPSGTSAPGRMAGSAPGGQHKRAGGRVGLRCEEQPLDGGEHGLGDGAAQPGVEQQQSVHRVREVAAVEPDGGHPGHPQQVPGLRVRPQVEHAGPGEDLAADQVGELLTDRGGGARAGAVVVAGHPAGVLGAVRVQVQREEQVGPGLVGEGGALGGRGVLPPPAGQVHGGAGRGQPPLDPRGQVEDQ